MKRRLGLLAVAGLLATLGFFAPSSPASADTDACVGQGTAILSTGFGYPQLTAKNTANFNFNFSPPLGACVAKTALTANGTVNGWCGLSTGKGTTINGHSFVFQSTGTVLVLTGEVTGTVSAAPDPTHSGSCTNKTATRFIITGSATKTHTCDTYTEVKNKDLNLQTRTCTDTTP